MPLCNTVPFTVSPPGAQQVLHELAHYKERLTRDAEGHRLEILVSGGMG